MKCFNSMLTYIQYIAPFSQNTQTCPPKHVGSSKPDYTPQVYTTEPSYISIVQITSLCFFLVPRSHSNTQYVWRIKHFHTHYSQLPEQIGLIQELHLLTAVIFKVHKSKWSTQSQCVWIIHFKVGKEKKKGKMCFT